MAIAKIQAGDNVKLIAGAYKGTEGVVTKVITTTKRKKTIRRIIVSSLPTIVKYQKSNAIANTPGSMTQTYRTVDISNVMLVDDGNPSRTKITTLEDGKKVRQFLKSGKTVTKTLLPRSKDVKELNDTK